MDSSPRATVISIEWDDGLSQRWTRHPNGHWNLTITPPDAPSLEVTGYCRKDMDRVLGAALKGTPNGLMEGNAPKGE